MPAKDEQLDDQKLTFGKYMFKTPNEIADIDPSYIVWLYNNVKPRVVSKSLAVACELDIAEDSESNWADRGDEHY